MQNYISELVTSGLGIQNVKRHSELVRKDIIGCGK